jgi:hypothetical protein
MNGTETSLPPQDTFMVFAQYPPYAETVLSLTVQNEAQDNFDAYHSSGGLNFQYRPVGGSLVTLAFRPVSDTTEYDQLQHSITETCDSGLVYCGDG